MVKEASRSKELLLQDYPDEDQVNQLPAPCFKGRQHRTKSPILWLAILALVLSNLFVFHKYDTLRSRNGLSEFAKLSFDTPTEYHNHTEYMGDDTVTDALWDKIDTSPLEVALTDEYAVAHGIEPSVFRFPWDESKGIYFLKVFHDLHCLKAMRRAYSDLERGLPRTVPSWHIYHCFDALRQDVTCAADDTPMPMTDFPNKVGNGQIRMCRSFDRLVEWTREPEQHACYKRFTDYGSVKNKIEMYAFCNEASEYYPLQKAYFEKWGHEELEFTA